MTLLVPFVPWVKWGLSFPQVSFLCDSQFKAPLESICTVLHFLYDFVFSTNREMKSGSGSVKATKQSAQWAKSTAGQGCLWGSPWMHAPYFQQVEDWKKKKKPNITLHFALFFFPFSTLTKKYVTPDSPSMLVAVRTNWFCALWNYMGMRVRKWDISFLPALVFCNSSQSLDSWIWVKEPAVVNWLCCCCFLVWKGPAWLFYGYSMSFIQQLTYPGVGTGISKQS